MGSSGSKLGNALGDQFLEGEKCLALENFDNTYYCALYFCLPFREHLLENNDHNKTTVEVEEDLSTCLANDLCKG